MEKKAHPDGLPFLVASLTRQRCWMVDMHTRRCTTVAIRSRRCLMIDMRLRRYRLGSNAI